MGQAQAVYRIKKLLFQEDFKTKLDTTHWFSEVKPINNNRIFADKNQLIMDVAHGATLWLKTALKDNWRIEFDRTRASALF